MKADKRPENAGARAASRQSSLGDANLNPNRAIQDGLKLIDKAMLASLADSLPWQTQNAADLVRSMRDSDRY